MHIGKVKYVEALLYGRLIGTLLTMPLYDCVDRYMLKIKGRGVSIQRFYTLLMVEIHQFYETPKMTVHTILRLCQLLRHIGQLGLHEKRKRQTAFARIESYLKELTTIGKT